MDHGFDTTKEYWNNEILRGNLVWPDEQVIRFVKRNFKPNSAFKILDFGCGAGRDTIALAQDGYQMIAMDYNQSGLDIINAKAEHLGLSNVQCIKNSGLDVPLKSESVQAIFADGSLFYYTQEDTLKLLGNLRKCLSSGGLFWANWRNKSDSLYRNSLDDSHNGGGRIIEGGLLALGTGSKREGCYYYFAELDELKKLYSNAGFTIKSIDTYTYTQNNGTVQCSWYHIVAEK